MQRFESATFSGVSYFPIEITKVGRRNAKLPPPIPESGEPEDIMELAAYPPEQQIPKYFEVVILADSRRVKETEPTSVCPTCGSENWKPPKKWAMHESLWTGTDFFFLAPTTMIVVTDRVKKLLVEMEATNVRAVPMG
jgi:hypothetical protein